MPGHEVDEIRDRLAERARHNSGDTTVTARELETAANDVRHLAVDYLRRGYELHAEAALTFADRLDETAELARLLRNKPTSASS